MPSVSAAANVDWNCNSAIDPGTLATAQDINFDRGCIVAGPDGLLQSATVGDDVPVLGLIEAGPDGVLQTTVVGGVDFPQAGRRKIWPGMNSTLDTVPQTGTDDFVRHRHDRPRAEQRPRDVEGPDLAAGGALPGGASLQAEPNPSPATLGARRNAVTARFAAPSKREG